MRLDPVGNGPRPWEAHEGDLTIELGFGTEPAYAGFPNSVQVILTLAGAPVTDANGLAVDVSFGDQTTTFDVVPNFEIGGDGQPGDYRANFVPTQPGPYTFRLRGEVDGHRLDVKMTSGPGTFDEVTRTADAGFPAVAVPSAEELAARLRTDPGRIDAAGAAARSAADAASVARTTAVIALAVGAIGVIAGIAGIVAARRTAGA